MEKFTSEFNEIFKKHGGAAARSGREVSYGTYHVRLDVLKHGFHALRTGKLVKLENDQIVFERGFKLASPWNFKQKHFQALVTDWVTRELSVAFVHNQISIWRQFCCWINKPNLVPSTEEIISDPRYQRRCQVALRDKSWSGCGIDVPVKILEIAGTDQNVATAFDLMREFSMRLKEASLLRPHQADQGVYLDINRGCKGGRERVHKIATPGERAVLERAKALVTDRMGCLVPPEKTYRQWQNRVYYVARKHGVCLKEVGTSTHGLRHEGLNRHYEEITGAKSPVQGGQPGEVSPAVDRFARAQVAEVAGHRKSSVSAAYLGGVLRGKKQSAI